MSRKDHQGASEASTWKQLETIEARMDRQGRTSGPSAVPRVEGEETEASALWGTSLHHQGPPEIESGQERGPPQELEPQEKIQGTAPRRKRDHTIVLSDPEMYVKPKALGEPHAPAHSDPPPGQEETN